MTDVPRNGYYSQEDAFAPTDSKATDDDLSPEEKVTMYEVAIMFADSEKITALKSKIAAWVEERRARPHKWVHACVNYSFTACHEWLAFVSFSDDETYRGEGLTELSALEALDAELQKLDDYVPTVGI